MFMHIGENTVINTASIIAIIDIDKTTVNKTTRDYFKKCEKSKIVVNVTEELPKSAVICESKGKRTVYLSQLSPQTLKKRIIVR